MKVPLKYVPKQLNEKDKKKQVKMLKKSKKLYSERKYYQRKPVKSFVSKPSNHVKKAKKIYQVNNIIPDRKLAKATGCSIKAMEKIVKKGQGAYYSSGSRPNQTAHSWGIARLASAITSGNAAIIDYHIIKKGCDHKKKAFKLAENVVKKRLRKSPKIKI
jgi:hypothetical protein